MKANYGHTGVILTLAKRKWDGWKCRFVVLDFEALIGAGGRFLG